jgi:hypothetical protein
MGRFGTGFTFRGCWKRNRRSLPYATPDFL